MTKAEGSKMLTAAQLNLQETMEGAANLRR
jgi:hypothetical protein